MEIRVLTLRYSPSLGAIDDAPLVQLARDHEVLGLREHFFIVHDIPHLLCVVSCQPLASGSRAAVTTTHSAGATPPSPPPPAPARAADPTAELEPEQRRMFETIRRWRYETAQRDGVPPYVVLTNRNLTALLRERPTSLAALGGIRGIGKATVERYGEALLALLRDEPSTAPALVAVAGQRTGDSPTTPAADADRSDDRAPKPEPAADA